MVRNDEDTDTRESDESASATAANSGEKAQRGQTKAPEGDDQVGADDAPDMD